VPGGLEDSQPVADGSRPQREADGDEDASMTTRTDMPCA